MQIMSLAGPPNAAIPLHCFSFLLVARGPVYNELKSAMLIRAAHSRQSPSPCESASIVLQKKLLSEISSARTDSPL